MDEAIGGVRPFSNGVTLARVYEISVRIHEESNNGCIPRSSGTLRTN
jgi:hypothetical protein